MDDTLDHYVPTRLDDDYKIWIVDADVALPTIAALAIGYLSPSKITFLLCLAIGVWMSKKFYEAKQTRHPRFLIHFISWHLPAFPPFVYKTLPPNHIRRTRG